MPVPVKIGNDQNLEHPSGFFGNPRLMALANGEFQINYFASDANGDGADIFFQRFYQLGESATAYTGLVFAQSALLEAQLTSTQLADGRILYTWIEGIEDSPGDSSNFNVRAGILNADNSISLAAFTVAGAPGSQGSPTVTASADGGFAISFRDQSAPDTTANVNFYDATGGLTGQVTIAAMGDVEFQDVEALGNGNYLVSWNDDAGGDTFAQIYASNGQTVGYPILVGTAGDEGAIDIVATALGGFVSTWVEGGVVKARFFESDGTSVGGAISVSTATANSDLGMTSAVLSDGRVVVVWTEGSDFFDADLKGRILNSDGTYDSAIFAINDAGAVSQYNPSIVVLADGRFVVGWDTESEAQFATFDPRTTRRYRPDARCQPQSRLARRAEHPCVVGNAYRQRNRRGGARDQREQQLVLQRRRHLERRRHALLQRLRLWPAQRLQRGAYGRGLVVVRTGAKLGERDVVDDRNLADRQSGDRGFFDGDL